MYDDTLKIVEHLISLHPDYRDKVVAEVMDFLDNYEGDVV